MINRQITYTSDFLFVCLHNVFAHWYYIYLLRVPYMEYVLYIDIQVRG